MVQSRKGWMLLKVCLCVSMLAFSGCFLMPLPLHEAAEEGNLAAVQRLVEQGANAYAMNELYPVTPLHIAAGNGHLDMVKFFISKGMYVNVRDADKDTPLHAAAIHGHMDVAQFLITEGADVNAKNDNDATPLHYAVLYGHTEVVELLIAEGADINARAIAIHPHAGPYIGRGGTALPRASCRA